MDELVEEFIAETREGLVKIERDLIALEERPEEAASLVGELFRVMHTIKGTCGFLGFARLERVAHAAENLLGAIRDGALEARPEVVSAVLRAVDAIRDIVESIAESRSEPAGDDGELLQQLESCLNGGAPGGSEAEGSSGAAEEAAPVPQGEEREDGAPPVRNPGEQESQGAEAAAPERAASGNGHGTAGESTAAGAAGEGGKSGAGAEPGRQEGPSRRSRTTSLRVSLSLLEALMGFVSELVLTRNQLMRLGKEIGRADLDAALQRLDHVTSELREGVMKTRMQPISNAWAGLPRLVRETAAALGKKVRFVTEGGSTELDRQMLETIKDPLTHMVRNSVDHGIEPPAERVAAGKPEQGTVRLSASQEGGTIVIRLIDDGRGLDPERIARKAVERGLCSESHLAGMSPQQIFRFIFEPGFSTAETVTSVSGRGVGMDVVRTNVEQIGGSIEVESTPGEGTSFTITLPLTLAIVPALIVGAADRRFALPQLCVVEIVRCDGGAERRIETVDDQPILRLRDQLLPLLSLRRVIGLEEEREPRTGAGYALVLDAAGQRFGLLVDQVFDNEEIVVEPIASILQDVTVLGGTTVLGDGSVAMVLDAKGVASHLAHARVAGGPAETAAAEAEEERITLLRFRSGDRALKAVPLALVARIEQVTPDQLQWADGQSLLLFQGRPMPVVDIEGAPLHGLESRKPVLVFEEAGRSFGVLVDEIEDIIESAVDLSFTGRAPHVLGCAVLEGVTCEIIDVARYVQELFGGWFRTPAEAAGRRPRVLVVDDSSFFRSLIGPVLEGRGFEVVTVESAPAALSLCEAGERFDVIVSDIEMPEMNGFAFVRRLRETAWRDVPVVALSARTAPEDVARGLEAGFRAYVTKLDREALFEAVKQNLAGAAA